MSLPVIPEGADAAQLRKVLADAGGQYLERSSAKSRDEMSNDERTELRSLANFIGEVDNVEKVLSRLESEKRATVEPKGPRAAGDQPVERSKDFLDQYITDEKFIQFQRSGEAGNTNYVSTLQGGFHKRALISEGDPLTSWGDGVTGAGTLVPRGDPIVLPARQRRLFIRDIVPSSDIAGTTNSITYIQELNPFAKEGGASAVAEGGNKPEVEMNWVEAIAPVRKIAAWVPITTEMIEDAPVLRGYINDRLTYMIKVREEAQLLAGDGTSPNISGILDQPGVQTQASVGTNDLPATVAQAYAKIENVDGEADAVAIHPITFWTAVASRHSTQFDAAGNGPSPSSVPNITWGLTPIRTRSIAQGKFLAGAFGTAAHIWDRQDVTIRTGNQHAEYFISNKIVVLAEERLAFTVWRPDLFIDGSVTITA